MTTRLATLTALTWLIATSGCLVPSQESNDGSAGSGASSSTDGPNGLGDGNGGGGTTGGAGGGTAGGGQDGDGTLFCELTPPYKLHATIRITDESRAPIGLPGMPGELWMHGNDEQMTAYSWTNVGGLTVDDYTTQVRQSYLIDPNGMCIHTELYPDAPLEPFQGLTRFTWDQFSGEVKTVEGTECHVLAEPIHVPPQFEDDADSWVLCVNRQFCAAVEERHTWGTGNGTYIGQVYDFDQDFDVDHERFDEPNGCYLAQ